jgi:hypothetical protein
VLDLSVISRIASELLPAHETKDTGLLSAILIALRRHSIDKNRAEVKLDLCLLRVTTSVTEVFNDYDKLA